MTIRKKSSKTVKKSTRTRKRIVKRKPYSAYVSHIPARLHMPIPQRYEGSFETCFYGTTASANSTATAHFNITATTFQFPMNGSVPFTGMGGTTLTPATTALNALTPLGYTALALLYEYYCVTASKLSVTMTPTAGADLSQLVLFPYNAVDSPEADTETGSKQPYSKAITVSGNNNIAKNRVSSGCTHYKFLGETKALYEAQNTKTITTADSSGVEYQCIYQTFSNAAFTAPVGWEVRLTQHVILMDPNAGAIAN